jgi:putative protease
LDFDDPGPYKLALKDMCLYDHLPDMIQSGVCSFKVEGRMRNAAFIRQIIRLYRYALDRYLAEPAGYKVDEQDLQEMRDLRIRDFSTCYAFKNPGAPSIGYTGEREPRFFSQAVVEVGMPKKPLILDAKPDIAAIKPLLAVRTGTLPAFQAALQAGADLIYIGGEVFPPIQPWTIKEFKQAVDEAQGKAKVVIALPRITMWRELKETQTLLKQLNHVCPAGILVTNTGILRLAAQESDLDKYADFPFNCFNSRAAALLKDLGVVQVTLAIEATYTQAVELIRRSAVSTEWLIHGGIPAMVLDHCIPAALLSQSTREENCPGRCRTQDVGLLDTAGQIHPIYVDQHCRNHILLARDLCLIPYLPALCATGVGSVRIEGQYYNPVTVGKITRIYREQMDNLWTAKADYQVPGTILDDLRQAGSRKMGLGVFRYTESK